MGRVAGKKLFSVMALGAMIGLLLLPIAVSLPSLAIGADAPDAVKKEGAATVEKGRDVYYKTEGIVVGAPAPKTTDGPKDYPRYNFESRVLIWFANQQHLYYGSFVLAVPIFCMVIEFMGVVSKDKAMAKRYDQLAHDFIKISLTAYSLTAILGGILIFTYLTLYPAFFGYLSSIFRPVMHIYALMFVAESGTLVHLLLWLGQDDDRVSQVDPLEYVRGFERDRYIAHVPGKFLDRLHDVAGRRR